MLRLVHWHQLQKQRVIYKIHNTLMNFEKTKSKEPVKALAFGKSNGHLFITSIFCRDNYYGQQSLFNYSTTRTIIVDKTLFIYSTMWMYHHSFGDILLLNYLTRQFRNLIYLFPAYLRRRSLIVQGRGVFWGSHPWDVLKQLWSFQVCYYKVRKWVLKWQITRELYSLL